MDLSEDLKMPLLNYSFVMIYVIHKMLVLLNNYLNYLTGRIFEYLFNEYNRLSFFVEKNNFLSQHIMMENLSLEEEKIY